jgi:hypothetical protein
MSYRLPKYYFQDLPAEVMDEIMRGMQAALPEPSWGVHLEPIAQERAFARSFFLLRHSSRISMSREAWDNSL